MVEWGRERNQSFTRLISLKATMSNVDYCIALMAAVTPFAKINR